MSYSHLAENAQEFARLAFDRINDFNLVPTPENYELWFVYFSKSNPELLKAADGLMANTPKLSAEQCIKLYNEYLSNYKQENRVKQAGDQIQRTISDVNLAVTSAKKNVLKYSSSLKSAKTEIEGADEIDKAKPILDGLLSETEKVMDSNEMLEEMLHVSTLAMEDMRRDLEIARMEALTDPLTGLLNRKAFDQEIERLMLIANDHTAPKCFSIILMDIDHFKAFNDNFGHQIGDQVLKLVARTITESVKGRDIIVRFGGEEFVVLLPETNLHGAKQIAEILRHEVEKKEVVNKATGKKLAKITLSAGVAEYCVHEESGDFIQRVDRALYSAKESGRNCVVKAS